MVGLGWAGVEFFWNRKGRNGFEFVVLKDSDDLEGVWKKSEERFKGDYECGVVD